jgi:flagellar biosynthesis component FlhA
LLALAAAVVALIGLICDWADVSSDLLSFPTFMLLATLLIALHLAGIGGTWRRGRTRDGV